jgi:hypothetical protein
MNLSLTRTGGGKCAGVENLFGDNSWPKYVPKIVKYIGSEKFKHFESRKIHEKDTKNVKFFIPEIPKKALKPYFWS